MKKRIINYRVDGKQLMISTLDSIQRVEFPYEIDKVENFENSLVVLLDIPMDVIFNENVFGVSAEGKVIWQIEKLKYRYENSPFIGMKRKDDSVVLYNSNDIDLCVKPESGEIIKKSFGK